jgi:hypothetical protein
MSVKSDRSSHRVQLALLRHGCVFSNIRALCLEVVATLRECEAAMAAGCPPVQPAGNSAAAGSGVKGKKKDAAKQPAADVAAAQAAEAAAAEAVAQVLLLLKAVAQPPTQHQLAAILEVEGAGLLSHSVQPGSKYHAVLVCSAVNAALPVAGTAQALGLLSRLCDYFDALKAGVGAADGLEPGLEGLRTDQVLWPYAILQSTQQQLGAVVEAQELLRAVEARVIAALPELTPAAAAAALEDRCVRLGARVGGGPGEAGEEAQRVLAAPREWVVAVLDAALAAMRSPE